MNIITSKASQRLLCSLLLTFAAVFNSLLAAETLTVSHRLGETEVPLQPQRVVVIGIGALDALHHLGIKPIGVNKEDLPDYLAEYNHTNYQNVGQRSDPNFERIYSLKPDLIIAGPRSVRAYAELSQIAPTVIFAAEYDGYWASTQRMWRMLGRIFALEEKVENIISEFDQQFAALQRAQSPQGNSALVVMHSGSKLSQFGTHSRFSIVYTDFGFSPSISDRITANHGNLISYELIQQSDPDYLLIMDKDQLTGRAQTQHPLLKHPLVQTTQAYQQQRIISININAWYIAIAGITATQRMIDDVAAHLLAA